MALVSTFFQMFIVKTELKTELYNFAFFLKLKKFLTVIHSFLENVFVLSNHNGMVGTR